jgi:hypothetical protein
VRRRNPERLNVRFALKATELLRGSEMTRLPLGDIRTAAESLNLITSCKN